SRIGQRCKGSSARSNGDRSEHGSIAKTTASINLVHTSLIFLRDYPHRERRRMLPLPIGSPIFLDASLFKLEPPITRSAAFLFCNDQNGVSPFFWRKPAGFWPRSALTCGRIRP